MSIKILIALIAIVAGVSLIGCGMSFCWLRWRKSCGKPLSEEEKKAIADPGGLKRP